MQSADCILNPMQSADCAGSQIACNIYMDYCRDQSSQSVERGWVGNRSVSFYMLGLDWLGKLNVGIRTKVRVGRSG